MKKIGFMLVLAVFTAGGMFAQTETSGTKAAVSLDLFPLLKGFIYQDSDAKNSLISIAPVIEFRAAPHISFAASLDLYFGKGGDIDILYWGAAAHARYYPVSEGLDGFFLDAGAGYNSFAIDGKTDTGGFAGLFTALKAGYKIAPKPGFFVEPSISYVYSKVASSSAPLPLGWQPGLAIGGVF